MRVYDVHVHLDKGFNPYRNYAITAYKNNIFKAVVFPFPKNNIDKVKEANQYITEAFESNMELFIPFFLIINDELYSIKSDKIMGFKEHFFLDPPTEDFFFPAYDFLQNNGLFLMIHPGSKKKLSPEDLINFKIRRIKSIKKNFPRLKIILAHSGRNLPFRAKGIKEIVSELKKYEDIYFDTSTIRTPKVIKEIVEIVGIHRILFGSDYPYNRKDEDIYTLEKDTILKADISDREKEDIFQNNFRRLFLKDFWVRRACNGDINKILFFIETLPKFDKKHLAITQKIDKIKRAIIQGKHVYILENKQSKIIGFIRVSDRHHNGALVEEIVIEPGSRGMGLSKILMEVIINKYSYLEAKTFADNQAVNKLNEKFGFEVVKKSEKRNILYWKKVRRESKEVKNA